VHRSIASEPAPEYYKVHPRVLKYGDSAFALEVGAIHRIEQGERRGPNWHARQELAAIQPTYHRASDPALRFLSLLRAAMVAGRAHVTERRGGLPDVPDHWG
jgi:hypothetical protein